MSENDGYDSGVYHEDGPVSDHATKQVLLTARNDDTIHVDGYGEMRVLKRVEPYFGVDLYLSEDRNRVDYRLIPAGFAKDPALWEKDGWGYRLVDHVSCEIVEIGERIQCECGELLEDINDRRQALVLGRCPHD